MPYDVCVCACLIVLAHHLGGQFLVRSDGAVDEDEGWVKARAACDVVLGYGSDFQLHEQEVH